MVEKQFHSVLGNVIDEFDNFYKLIRKGEKFHVGADSLLE